MPKSTPAKLKFQAEYNARPENVQKRVLNNAARREAIADGKVTKGDGKDVSHVKALDKGGKNTPGNTKVQDASKNRAWRAKEPEIYTKKK